MYTKIKSEWKTYNEMNTWEKMDFKRFEGWKTYQCRRKGKEFEYLVETWKKVEK